MHSIPLFRPASCGGRASLSFLLRKLARVRWAMLGHVLTVVEVRHA